ncbi:MAG: thiamine pyrophosphate-dependent enzyme [Fimbriimonadales bacterium]|nr:thiamine pyrophosphate-dependent enzyme [Fimbriimonadales bacterium]
MDTAELLLLGDEAVGLGAIHAGIAGAFSYPGTPATEIFETVERLASAYSLPIWCRWSPNEKVAYEEALGMSYAGRRALVSMKHVGLNVAADPFVNSALTGVNGGLVLACGDDPGMHSSQNEQDSRWLAEFAKVPCLEPASQQEAYELTLEAFELSERLGLPVMLRLTTRLAHTRSNVLPRLSLGEWPQAPARPLPDPNDWTLVPTNARRRFRRLLSLQPQLDAWSDAHALNALRLSGPRGIVACGLGWNVVAELLPEHPEFSWCRVVAYPPPIAKIRQLADHCDELLFLEEGYPWLESRALGLLGLRGKRVMGRTTGDLCADGELVPEQVLSALGLGAPSRSAEATEAVPRPPVLCRGCPHADTFRAIAEATAPFESPGLFSDIGCYTLGAFPPYRAVKSCVDMGASIAMAHGAARGGLRPVLCTIGDSTFAHSGIGPLLSAIQTRADITVVILDNGTVAMTGAQQTLLTGDALLRLLHGLGAEDVTVIEPLPKNHSENVRILREALERPGVSVIVAHRSCIHAKEPPCGRCTSREATPPEGSA